MIRHHLESPFYRRKNWTIALSRAEYQGGDDVTLQGRDVHIMNA